MFENIEEFVEFAKHNDRNLANLMKAGAERELTQEEIDEYMNRLSHQITLWKRKHGA